MRLLPLVLFLVICAELGAQTPDELVAAGRGALAAHNLPVASSNFEYAVRLLPDYAPANALAAATRAFLVPQQTPVANFLNRLGVSATGRDVYRWTATLTRDTNGNVVLPPALYSSEAIRLCSNSVQPVVSSCISNLSRITDPGFRLSLTAAETYSQAMTVDFGDVLLARSLLNGADFAGHMINANNLTVGINALKALGDQGKLSIQTALANYPALLTLSSKPELAKAKAALASAIRDYLAASDFIRNGRSNSTPLFALDSSTTNREAAFREQITTVLASLDAPAPLGTNTPATLFAGAAFTGAKSIRSLLPRFNGNYYVNSSLPDYTFGGVLADQPAWETEMWLREQLNTPAPGVYMGRTVNAYDGWLAVFVNSNNVARLLSAGSNWDDPTAWTSVASSFQVQPDGHWNFTTNGVAGAGYITRDGALSGELYFFGPVLYAYPIGVTRAAEWSEPFQPVAGAYDGSWSSAGQGGMMQAILAADGRLFYALFDATNGVRDIGGQDVVLGANGAFASTSMASATFVGNLASGPQPVISGTFTNTDQSFGTFSLGRQAGLPPDVPPKLLAVPVSQTLRYGQTATFTVRATGTPPLCYQWSSNGIPVLHATTPTFTVTNLQPENNNNTFLVTVSNVGAQTNAAASLQVLPETTPPKLTLLAPLNRQSVTSPVFSVRGLATDNFRLESVRYRLNGAAWTRLDPGAPMTSWNWSVPVNLVPGTNVIQVCAFDLGGYSSPTSSVTMFFLVPSQLTLLTNGVGAIYRTFVGTTLQLGMGYSVTALPGAGQVFSNWTGSISSPQRVLNFTMQTNMVLQANFVPNPFLAAKGTYTGLFAAAGPRAHSSSGWFRLLLTDRGSFSGTLLVAAKPCSFTGQFLVDGTVTLSVPRAGTAPLSVALGLNLSSGADQLTGTLSDGQWMASLVADKPGFGAGRPAPFAGVYTFASPGGNDPAAGPGGDSCGTLSLSAAGVVIWNLWFADGAAATRQTSVVAKDGRCPIYAGLYGSSGSAWSWLQFATNADSPLGGTFSWLKPAQVGPIYSGGFTNTSELNGSRYAPAYPVINLTNGIVVLTGGGLGQAVTNPVVLRANNAVVNAGSNAMSLTLFVPFASWPYCGLFSGRAVAPGAPAASQFLGVVLQNGNAGYGYFLGANQSGRVYFGAPPPP